MYLCIAREVEMPALPRSGEAVLVGGKDKEKDYLQVHEIYHDPLIGEIQVKCECPYIWLMLATWRSVEGWTIIESTKESKDKFLHYLEHPEEETKEPITLI